MSEFKEKLSLLPKLPGVYKFLNNKGNILYVGKAGNLFNRVNSYFNKNLQDRPRIISMIPLITDVETITVDNEIEALVLEAALIKKYKPKYNSLLKDDKSYVYIYINTRAEYPSVKIVRNISTTDVKSGVYFGPYPSGSLVRRVYKFLRKMYPFCLVGDPRIRCFDSQIGLCPGSSITKNEYRDNINSIIKFLKGRKLNILSELRIEMNNASKDQKYEYAAKLRDKIEDLEYITSKIDTSKGDKEYIKSRKSRLLQEAKKLATELNISSCNRIECYDISNTSGKLSYGSMSVLINGEPVTSQYRIFKINSDGKPDDYKMLAEVLSRRLNQLKIGLDDSFKAIPDVILIDGGIGQINSVKNIIPRNIYLLGITKGRKYKRKGGKLKDEFINRNGEKIKIKYQRMLSQIRDEAHRFAILHHRKARIKNQKTTILDSIPGIGVKTRRKLLQEFKNIDTLKVSSFDEINSIVRNKNRTTLLIKFLSNQ